MNNGKELLNCLYQSYASYLSQRHDAGLADDKEYGYKMDKARRNKKQIEKELSLLV